MTGSSPKQNIKPSQADLARKAEAMRHAAEPAPRPDPEQTANDGMPNNARGAGGISGNFDAEGQRPVLERSRKTR